MALINTSIIRGQQPQQKQGLFKRLMGDPNAMSLTLMGLGLLGSKRRSQADRYLEGVTGTLGRMSDQRAQAPLQSAQVRNLDAQSGYYDAQTQTEGAPGGFFDKGGAGLNAMRVVTTLGAKIARGEPLNDEERMAYQTARNHLSKTQVITTADGRQISIPPMDTSYLPQLPGMPATTSPVLNGPGVGNLPPGGNPISASDPFKKADADRVVAATETGQKYTDTIPFLDAIEKDLEMFGTGKLAGPELKLRALGDAVGIGDESTLAAGERLNKNINKLVSQNMEFLKGAMSEGERQFTKEFSIGMDTSVEGNKAYIGFLRAVAERASRQGEMMRDYFRSNGNSLDGWESHWRDYIKSNPVPVPEIEDESESRVIEYDPITGTFSE